MALASTPAVQGVRGGGPAPPAGRAPGARQHRLLALCSNGRGRIRGDTAVGAASGRESRGIPGRRLSATLPPATPNATAQEVYQTAVRLAPPRSRAPSHVADILHVSAPTGQDCATERSTMASLGRQGRVAVSERVR